jgi:hypothetical protein
MLLLSLTTALLVINLLAKVFFVIDEPLGSIKLRLLSTQHNRPAFKHNLRISLESSIQIPKSFLLHLMREMKDRQGATLRKKRYNQPSGCSILTLPQMKRIPLLQRLVTVLMILSVLTACSLPQVSAEERMFLDVSLDFLGEYPLSSTLSEAEPPIRHLSGITYQLPGYGASDTPGTYFYGVSDDEDHSDGVKLYQLKLDLNRLTSDGTDPSPFTVETVTVLKDQLGQAFQDATFQLESLAFTPRQSVFIAAEQIQDNQTVPLIGEFDLQTGQLKNTVPLPPNYRPQAEEEQPQGIQPDFGFRAMTIAPDGFSLGGLEPFRLFTTTATPLFQDLDAEATQLRLLHYVIADRASFLISENLYSLDSQSDTDSPYQLAGVVALPESGHFLSLERSPDTLRRPSQAVSGLYWKCHRYFSHHQFTPAHLDCRTVAEKAVIGLE